MLIRYRNIVLRDMEARDIDDEIRWNTVETQWANWDAPWESLEELKSFDPEAHRRNELEQLKKPRPALRSTLELDTEDGTHIGSVSAYRIDEEYNWLPPGTLRPGQKAFHALGVDISESSFWGRGLGKQALAAWISYFLGNGVQELYLQTWSGNTRMVRAAERLGFTVCCRKQGLRQVRGEAYDGLTFRLDLERFRLYLLEENVKALGPRYSQG